MRHKIKSLLRRAIRREKLSDVSLHIEGEEASLKVKQNTVILNALKENDIQISYYCGGNCSCGTCRIQIVEGASNLSPALGREVMVLGHENSQKGDRLACQVRIMGDVRILIPKWF
jgi:ferredoxin